jgi:hypothetical protein
MAHYIRRERLLALRVVLLRIRLLAIRSLLRWVVALRYFVRRRGQIAAGMRAHIRVDPWASARIVQRNGHLVSALIVGAACAVTGFMMGGHYEKGNWAPSPTAEAVANSSTVKLEDTGKETHLAPKGENANSSTEGTQTKPVTPHVVVLNPGTADHEGDSQAHQASAPTRTAPLTRPAGNDLSRPDFTYKKASGDRPSRGRRPMQNYRDLRDYMLTR